MEYRAPELVTNPLVSVIVTTYNRDKLFGKSMDSVLRQKTTFPFEVIIGENCSTDNTRDLCLDYFEKNKDKIFLIAREKNIGGLENGMDCLKRVRGKYFCSCCDDDWWCDDYKLQKQVDYMEKNHDCAMIYSKAKVYLYKNKKYASYNSGKDCCRFEQILVSNDVPALTCLYNHEYFNEFYNEVNGDKICRDICDVNWPFAIWAARRKKIHFQNEVTGVFGQQVESWSISNTPERVMFLEKNCRKFRKWCYAYFNASDEKLWNRMELKYYIETMRWAPLAKDIDNIKERNELFLKNKLYVNYLFSQLFAVCGTHIKLNAVVNFLKKICRVLGLFRMVN